MSVQDKFDLLSKGTAEIYNQQELLALLESGKTLKVKAGFDPTATDLHLGHSVLLYKLRQFQELGHQIIFLIGDFTGLIGDPTGKNITRKPLTKAQVEANALTYTQQVFKILDQHKTRVVFNSEWMDKLNARDMIQLASQYTVARMLERDDFSKRYKAQSAIAVHEFLYPLLQGYDSVVLDADIELGGTDQTFNLLVGRELQRNHGMKPQVVMTMPILEGLDGVQKMSKSLNNSVALEDKPQDMFGKLMSICDELMWRYYELLSAMRLDQLVRLQASVKQAVQPGKALRDAKVQLAKEIVNRLHGSEQAQLALEHFTQVFQKKHMPEQLAEKQLNITEPKLLTQIIKDLGITQSTSDALRLIKQKAVKIDECLVEDGKLKLLTDATYVVQVGKKHLFRLKTFSGAQ